MIPGVAYDVDDPSGTKPELVNLRKIVGVVTYGQPWTAALWMGDVSHKTVTRFLSWFTGGKAKIAFLALYGVDGSTDRQRGQFIARVEKAMRGM